MRASPECCPLLSSKPGILWTMSHHHSCGIAPASTFRLKEVLLQIIWIIPTPGVLPSASPAQMCSRGERAGQGWNKRLKLIPSQLQWSKDNIYQEHTQAVLAVPKGSIDKWTHSLRALRDLPGAGVKQNAPKQTPEYEAVFVQWMCHSAWLWCPSCPQLFKLQTSSALPAGIQSTGCGKPRPSSLKVPPDHQVPKVTLGVPEDKKKKNKYMM